MEMFNQNINNLLSFGVFFVIYEFVRLEFKGEFQTWYYFWYLMYNRKQSVTVEQMKNNLITRRKFIISTAVISISGYYFYKELKEEEEEEEVKKFFSFLQEHYSFRCAYAVDKEILELAKIENQKYILFNTLLIDKFFINSSEHNDFLKKI